MIELAPPDGGPPLSFADVLDARHSRHPTAPASLPQLGALLWHACRTRATYEGRHGGLAEHRAAASAGGLHPLKFVVVTSATQVLVYDPLCHALGCARLADEVRLADFCGAIRGVAPHAEVTAVVLLADANWTDAVYDNAASLIWRDAGCALATLHLCATWLGLDFCPVGLLGTELLGALAAPERVLAAGACVVGDPARSVSR